MNSHDFLGGSYCLFDFPYSETAIEIEYVHDHIMPSKKYECLCPIKETVFLQETTTASTGVRTNYREL